MFIPFPKSPPDGVVLIDPDYFNKEGKQDRKGEEEGGHICE